MSVDAQERARLGLCGRSNCLGHQGAPQSCRVPPPEVTRTTLEREAPGLELGVLNFQKHCLVLLPYPLAIFLMQEYGDTKLRSPVTPLISEKKRRKVFKQSFLLLLSFRGDKEAEVVLHTQPEPLPCPVPSPLRHLDARSQPWQRSLGDLIASALCICLLPKAPCKSTSPASAWPGASVRGTPILPRSAEPSLWGACRPGTRLLGSAKGTRCRPFLGCRLSLQAQG